tara:strand:+ start:6078 stop:6182 length:105 start_codon:yes stop_codon:yes gene_type:complete
MTLTYRGQQYVQKKAEASSTQSVVLVYRGLKVKN